MKRKITEEEDILIKDYFKQGMSITEISFKMQISPHTIRYHVSEKFRESIKKETNRKYWEKKKAKEINTNENLGGTNDLAENSLEHS